MSTTETEQLGAATHSQTRQPETRAMIISFAAMLVATFIVVPILLAQTIGTGNILLFMFVIAPIGIIAGDYALNCALSLNTALVGWITGATLRYVIVGPFVIRGRGMSPRVRWEPRRASSSDVYDGTYAQDPTGQKSVQRARYAFILTGLALLVSALLLAILISSGIEHWLLRVVAVALASMIVRVVASVLPTLAIRQSPDNSQSQRAVAVERAVVGSTNDVRPGGIDPSHPDRLIAPVEDSTSYDVAGWLSTAESALERRDFDEAERSLMQALVNVNMGQITLMTSAYLLAAFMAAYRDGDAMTARIWQKMARSQTPEVHTQARIEAAILMAEGNTQAAIETARQGLATLEHSLDPRMAKLDESLLNDILKRLTSDIPDPSTEATA